MNRLLLLTCLLVSNISIANEVLHIVIKADNINFKHYKTLKRSHQECIETLSEMRISYNSKHMSVVAWCSNEEKKDD